MKRSINNTSLSCREPNENSSIKYLKIRLCSTFKKCVSLVWSYYGELVAGDGQNLDESNYYCKSCLEIEKAKLDNKKPAHLSKIHSVKRSTSSGSMKNHLLLVHKIVTDKVSTEEKNNNILKNWCSVSGSSSKAKFDITRDIALWFCTDLLSFNFVERTGFINFFEKNLDMSLHHAHLWHAGL